MGKRKAYPRGEAGRRRPPLSSGTRYDYALATGSMIFFGEGMRGQLGGSPWMLATILDWLGLHVECASTIRMDLYVEREKASRAAGDANRAFMTHAAHTYGMPLDYVRELWTRDYLYRDEIDPRWELAGLAGSSIVEPCLPGVVKQTFGESNAAYRALELLLRALPGSVYEANLLEFMFEHHEANGRPDVRARWAAMWR